MNNTDLKCGLKYAVGPKSKVGKLFFPGVGSYKLRILWFIKKRSII